MSHTPLRQLQATPSEVLSRLPAMGRIMLISSASGVTHERIGLMTQMRIEGESAFAEGPDHDARIHLPAIASVSIDRSQVMRDKVFPRLDFRDASGTAIFSAVGFEGLEPFDAALAGLAEADGPPAPAAPAFAKGEEAKDDDPGRAPLDRAIASGQEITVRVERPGHVQAWRGRVEVVKPSMGFLNILIPNFHFHLKAGAVASWERSEVAGEEVLTARDAEGHDIGLRVVFHAA